MNRLLVLIVLLCSAGLASAADVENFEGAWAGTGMVVDDPANPANHVLKLIGGDGPDEGTEHDILQIPVPSGTYGTFTIDVYDFGATMHDSFTPIPVDSDYGPRWGVVGDAIPGGAPELSAAAGIIHKSFLDANEGYAYSIENEWTGSWFSPEFFDSPRRVRTDPVGTIPISGNGLQKIGTGTPTEPEIAGTGAWTTWVFDVAQNGDVTITAKASLDAPDPDATQTSYGPFPMNVGTLTGLWVSGGRDTAFQGFGLLGVHGVLVDNITFTGPAVATVPGDYNGNDVVDAADYVVWRDSMGQTGDGLAADGDGNGAVETADYVYWKTRFGNTSGSGLGSGSAAVPEPACFTLFAAALLTAWGLRWRGA